MTDLTHSGKRIVYPKVEIHRTLSTDEVCEKLHSYNRTYSPSIVKAILEDLSDFMVKMMDMGYNIKLDGLGTFSLSIGFTDEKDKEMQGENDKMLYRKVAVKDVNYKVDTDFLSQLKRNVDLERVQSQVQTIAKSKYTAEERIERAKKHIEKYGVIYLQEYANLNGMSRSVASRELKRICEREDSPFKSRGLGSHKFWVMR